MTAPVENQSLPTLCIYIRLRNGIKLKVMMSSQEMRQSSSLAYKSISQKHGVIQLKRQLNIVARQYCKKYKNVSLFQSICIAPSLFGPPFESFSGTLLLITIFIRDPLGKWDKRWVDREIAAGQKKHNQKMRENGLKWVSYRLSPFLILWYTRTIALSLSLPQYIYNILSPLRHLLPQKCGQTSGHA